MFLRSTARRLSADAASRKSSNVRGHSVVPAVWTRSSDDIDGRRGTYVLRSRLAIRRIEQLIRGDRWQMFQERSTDAEDELYMPQSDEASDHKLHHIVMRRV